MNGEVSFNKLLVDGRDFSEDRLGYGETKMRSPGGRLDLFGCGITVSLARTFGVIFAIYLVLQVNVNIADAKVSTNTRMVV